MAEKTNKERQVEEALVRLSMLEKQGLHGNVKRDFKKGRLNYSERVPFGHGAAGALFWLDNEARFEQVVRKFEEEWHGVVYHVTHERTGFGELLDIFYVSQHEDEWEMDRDDLDEGIACCYVANLDDELMSEIGQIGFRVAGGGLVRTY